MPYQYSSTGFRGLLYYKVFLYCSTGMPSLFTTEMIRPNEFKKTRSKKLNAGTQHKTQETNPTKGDLY
jgi:hypothetical protein